MSVLLKSKAGTAHIHKGRWQSSVQRFQDELQRIESTRIPSGADPDADIAAALFAQVQVGGTVTVSDDHVPPQIPRSAIP